MITDNLRECNQETADIRKNNSENAGLRETEMRENWFSRESVNQ